MPAAAFARPGDALLTGTDGLRRFLAGLVEGTFQVDLGVADPALTDYLTDLLVRFTRREALPTGAGGTGAGGSVAVAGLIRAADAADADRPGVLRHAGDVALFLTGVHPPRRDPADVPAALPVLGKLAYRAAAAELPAGSDRPVLTRLAEHFELCGDGLARVRGAWARAA